MTIRLVYWDIRGLAEPIRLMLRYKNLEWIDDRLSPDMDGHNRYMDLRQNPNMVLANLPFLLDGDVCITQSLACIRYLGRKLGIMPKGERDLVLCETVEQEIYELKNRMTEVCYSPYHMHTPNMIAQTEGKHDFHYLKNRFINRIKNRLPLIGDLMKGDFLLGDEPVYVDFILYEFIDQFKVFAPQTFSDMSKINKYLRNFEQLKGNREWFEGEGQSKQYINAPLASWHGKEDQEE